jgi:hypothetical protein
MLLRIGRLSALGGLLLLTIDAAPAAAQASDPDRQPIGRFAVDARFVSARYTDDPGLATFLDVTRENLAKRGLGVVFGGHVYPLRIGKHLAFGLGGEMMFSRGSKTLTPETDDDEEEPVDGPTVTARLSAVSPQVSLNFGGRDGWSYLSGGIGWTTFSSEVKNETGAPATSAEDAPRTSTINYGGGARWFMKSHVAFSFDVRFYAIRPQAGTATLPTLARRRLLMLSAGVSFK